MKAHLQGWRRLATLILPLALFAAATAPASAGGNPNEIYQFDIEAGDAAYRLNDFSTQAGLQLLFGFEAMKGIPITPVHGPMKPFDALDKMIAGTRIKYEFINKRTVTLTLAPPQRASVERANATPKAIRVADRRAPDGGLEQVTIQSEAPSTVSHIGTTMLTMNRTEIDAGRFVTPQAVMRTLPQVFGGGPTEDTELGFEARSNAAKGYGINLRGLGASSTLVLLNGRRLASGGSEALFVDVSNVPLGAVERIDILPDSSSTYYGADAAAGVVNFVMRDDFDGWQSEAYRGSVTDGHLDENYLSQLVGGRTDRMRGFMALEFYSRDDLPASSREQARSDLTAWGGTNFDVVQSNPGTIVQGSRTWAIPGGQDGTALTPADFQPGTRNLQNRYEGASLLPSQQRLSLFSSGRLNLTDRFTLFGDALVGRRNMRADGAGFTSTLRVPVTNAFYVNPAGSPGPVSVAYNFGDDLGPRKFEGRVKTFDASAGVEAQLGADWGITGTAGYASERLRSNVDNLVDPIALDAALRSSNRDTAFNPFGDGSHTNPATLESLRTSNPFSTRSNLASVSLMARGPVTRISGGEVMLTLGADTREQSFESAIRATTTGPLLTADLDRSIQSTFAELNVPLIGADNARRGLESLEISLAERYEHYSDFGDTTAARFGVAWEPARGITARATYSESFRPPGLADLDESTNAYTVGALPDAVPGGFSPVLFWTGKNRDLNEERARSWTAGLEFNPENHPGSALALTYFNTAFTNRLNFPAVTADMLSNPSLSALITRNPSPGYLEEVCSRAPIAGTLDACGTTPVAAVVDLRVRNDAMLHTRGVDLLARYERNTDLGKIAFGLNGTYILDFSEAQTRDDPLQNRVSTPTYPVNLRFRASARWKIGGFDLSTFVNYTNSYLDTASVSRRHVDSWTTVDLHASYTLESVSSGNFSGTTIAVGADNLFNADPPFLNNAVGIGYDQENGDLIGRVVSLTVRKKW